MVRNIDWLLTFIDTTYKRTIILPSKFANAIMHQFPKWWSLYGLVRRLWCVFLVNAQNFLFNVSNVVFVYVSFHWSCQFNITSCWICDSASSLIKNNIMESFDWPEGKEKSTISLWALFHYTFNQSTCLNFVNKSLRFIYTIQACGLIRSIMKQSWQTDSFYF